MQYIPINYIVKVNPSVLTAGPTDFELEGLFISRNENTPTGTVLEFNGADAVADWYGDNSYEAQLANTYFNGFTNATKYPYAMFFVGQATQERAAWVRGSSMKGVTLAQLRAITGEFSVNVDGEDYTVTDVDFSSAESFTDVATYLTEQLSTIEDDGGQTVVITNAVVTWDQDLSCFKVTSPEAGAGHSVSSPTGAAAEGLGFYNSQSSAGADAETLTSVLNFAKDQNYEWFTFTMVEEATEDEMAEMAVWANNQNYQYGFIASDANPAIVQPNQDTVFGAKAKDLKYNAVQCNYDPNENPDLKAFVMGMLASIDWGRYNGRLDVAFKGQGALRPTCRSEQQAENIINNGYSFYGAFSGRGRDNTWNAFYNGNMPGNFSRLGMFANQGWLCAKLRNSIFQLMVNVKSIPYNEEGYTMIRASMSDAINAALNNGVIRTGVALSETQKVTLISQTGKDISSELYNYGYYIHIEEATAEIRARRGSPVIYFYYCDGGSIEKVMLPATVIE